VRDGKVCRPCWKEKDKEAAHLANRGFHKGNYVTYEGMQKQLRRRAEEKGIANKERCGWEWNLGERVKKVKQSSNRRRGRGTYSRSKGLSAQKKRGANSRSQKTGA